jgi:hypothetical protein
MKKLVRVFLGGLTLHAQVDPLEGLCRGTTANGHVSATLVARRGDSGREVYLAPGASVRSTSEVLMHTAPANFWAERHRPQMSPT